MAAKHKGYEIKAFDNGGKTADRFTLYIQNDVGGYSVFTMSADARSPLGVNMFSHDTTDANIDETDSEIAFVFLPAQVKIAAFNRIEDAF